MLFRQTAGSLLTKHQFRAGITNTLARFELSVVKFGTPSYRIGRPSMVAAMGYSATDIQRLGRWHSSTYRAYACPLIGPWVFILCLTVIPFQMMWSMDRDDKLSSVGTDLFFVLPISLGEPLLVHNWASSSGWQWNGRDARVCIGQVSCSSCSIGMLAFHSMHFHVLLIQPGGNVLGLVKEKVLVLHWALAGYLGKMAWGSGCLVSDYSTSNLVWVFGPWGHRRSLPQSKSGTLKGYWG